MATTVKNKIRLGTLFLFLLVLLSCGIGIYHLVRLKNDTSQIVKNNYESLDYCHHLQRIMDSTTIDRQRSNTLFDSILKLQETNITEVGEKDATRQIRQAFASYAKEDPIVEKQIRYGIHHVLSLNMAA